MAIQSIQRGRHLPGRFDRATAALTDTGAAGAEGRARIHPPHRREDAKRACEAVSERGGRGRGEAVAVVAGPEPWWSPSEIATPSVVSVTKTTIYQAHSDRPSDPSEIMRDQTIPETCAATLEHPWASFFLRLNQQHPQIAPR